MIRFLVVFFILHNAFLNAKELTFARDPFEAIWNIKESKPLSLDTDQEIIIRLKGIIWDDTDPAATMEFNRIKKVVYTGDTVGYITILSISQKHVTFSSKNKVIVLTLGKDVSI